MESIVALRLLDQIHADYQRDRREDGKPDTVGMRIDYRDYLIKPGEYREIPAADSVFIVDFADEGIVIESDTGRYSLSDQNLTECQHRHQGVVQLTNTYAEAQRVTFLVGIYR
jgi:hypothetical protein